MKYSNPGKREESQDKYLETDSFFVKKQEKNLQGTNAFSLLEY